MLEVTLEEGNLVEKKLARTTKNSIERHSTSSPKMALIPSDDSQIEYELTKALLVLNPELLTPKQALEIVYDLRAKAQSKSYDELSGVDVKKT